MARKSTGRSKRSGPGLSREGIELAALELIERGGLASFSQRALARALGVEAMSLYHWFPSQLELLNALLDRVMVEVVVPANGSPRERLTEAGLAFRRVALRYPAFVGGFVLPHRFNTEVSLALLESLLGVFRDAGFAGEPAARRFRAWVQFVMGALLDETSGYTSGPGATHPPNDAEVAARYPLVAALGPHNQRAHHEASFRFGLEAILRGIER